MRLYKLLLITLLFASCAQISNPNGGPKDTSGPKIIKLSPENQSTLFKTNQLIEIQLDEYIKLNNLNKELIISPPISPKPEITSKGKTIKINLTKTSLNPNTTYSINFGESIVDFNEGNPMRNFTYVFSTGETIDSLSLSGSIIESETGFLAINTTVLLFDNTTDTFLKTNPSYLTKTDSFGNYTFNNLPSSKFKIYAIKDNNNNRLFDDGESIAFQTNLINSEDQNSVNPILHLFKPIYYPKLVIRDTISSIYATKIVFNKPLNEDYFKITTSTIPYLNTSISKDTLVIYNTTLNKNNSTNNIISVSYLDSTIITIYESSDSITNIKSKPSFLNINKLHEKDTLYIKFNSPIYTFNPSFISLIKDSIKYPSTLIQTSLSTFSLTSNFIEDNNYSLLYNSKFLYDTIEDIDTFNLYINPNKRYGSIICSFKADSSIDITKYLIQIIRNKQVISTTQINNTTMYFNYLREGDYKIKIIKDLDNNKEWTRGDQKLNRQPEPIQHYQNEINVKSNWDIDIDINLS